MKISLCIITLNEEKNLARCLASISGLADEILVVDSGSTDATSTIARNHGARVVHQPWLGYVGQKNHALSLASHPWILSLDADEELSPKLHTELSHLKNSPAEPDCAGFSMPRCVLYEGKWIRHGDWYPDRLTRLFRQSKARFAGARVHERLELDGPVQPLSGDIHHYSFDNQVDHQERSRRYARLWAESALEQGRRAGPLDPWLHALFRWIRGYLLRGGFLDGRHGFTIARLCAAEVALKYRTLRQLQKGHR